MHDPARPTDWYTIPAAPIRRFAYPGASPRWPPATLAERLSATPFRPPPAVPSPAPAPMPDQFHAALWLGFFIPDGCFPDELVQGPPPAGYLERMTPDPITGQLVPTVHFFGDHEP